MYSTWAERKVAAFLQDRVGPNRAGWGGLLQPLADGMKLFAKEEFEPNTPNKFLFMVGPAIAMSTALMTSAVIPWGDRFHLFGRDILLQATDIDVALLYIFGVVSVGVYGIMIGGWASNNKFSLIGAVRAASQMVSYEVAMGLSLVAVFIYAGSMSTSDIVAAQSTWWYGVVLFPSFAIYAISMVGETNRAPFDLAEAEGELVGGFHTEYSSLKFALFFLAEYVNIIAVSALATTLFLGGYHAPPGLGFTEAWLGGWFTAIWFFLKVLTFFFVFVWLRGTLPRLRYDQFMQFGWKVLIPVSILWILVVATLRVLSLQNAPRIVVIAFASSVVFIIMAVNVGFESAKKKKEQAIADGDNKAAPKFAVPSLPMEVSTINVSQKVGGKRE